MAFSAVVLTGCGGKDDPAPGPIIPPASETPAAEKFEVGQVMPAWAEGYMDIHSINCGRGEAFYYIFPDGTTMLVDAAGAPPNELYDYGSDAAGVDSKPNVNENSGKVIVNYIKHFAPSVAGGKLDYFVSSHYHGDHIGSWRADYNKFGWTPYDKDGNPVQRLLCEGSARNTVWNSCDFGGYLQMLGTQRTICFTPEQEYFAKGTHGINGKIAVPFLDNKHPNTFMTQLFEQARKNIEAEKEYFEPLKAQYAATMENVQGIIADIVDAETANVAAETIAGLEHALTSKQEALAMLTEKTNALGLKYTKKDGYVLKGE